MKKISKITVLMVLLSFIVSLFVGCTADEIELFNAMNKAMDIKSMQSKTNMALTLDVTGLPKEQEQEMQTALMMLNNMKISVDSKSTQNDAKTVSKTQADITVEVGGMPMKAGFWVDSDLTGKQPSVKEILQIPAIAKMALPKEYQNKEYLVLDTAEALKGQEVPPMDISKSVTSALDFQKSLIAFLKDNAANINPGVVTVTKKGTKNINGEELPLYELKLDDGTVKKLIRYGLTDLVKNESFMKIFKDYMLGLAEMMSSTGAESQEAKTEIEKSVKDFEKDLPKFIEQVNKTMDVLDKVKFVGDKGITVNYAINKDGYLVNESGSGEIVIDVVALDKAMAALDTNSKNQLKNTAEIAGVYKIGFTYDTNVTNINQPVEIVMPKVDSKNSISYMSLVESTLGTAIVPANKPKPIKVKVNNKAVTFDVQPEVKEGRVLVPLRGIFESLGAKVSWDQKTKTITAVKGSTKISMKLGSKNAVVNGKKLVLDTPPVVVNNRTLIPLRFVSENLGADVKWDSATRVVTIVSK